MFTSTGAGACKNRDVRAEYAKLRKVLKEHNLGQEKDLNKGGDANKKKEVMPVNKKKEVMLVTLVQRLSLN